MKLVSNNHFDTKKCYQSLLRAKKKIKKIKDKSKNISEHQANYRQLDIRYKMGTWADNKSCDVSATGHGEYFILYNVAANIFARVKYQNKSLRGASNEVIFGEMHKDGGTGGVIVINTQGDIALTFNTKGIYRASRKQGEKVKDAIFGDVSL